MPTIKTTCIAAVLAAGVATGCGDENRAANAVAMRAIQPGDVVFQDALDDNANGWLEVEDLVYFEGGKYVWEQIPDGQGGASGSEKANENPPDRRPRATVWARATRCRPT